MTATATSDQSTETKSKQVSANPFAAHFGELDEILKASEANVDATELEISRLAICQPQSKEISGEVTGYKGGMILDNKSRVVLSSYGPAPWLAGKIDDAQIPKVNYIELVPIFKLPSEYIKWYSKEEQRQNNKMWDFKELDFHLQHVRAGLWPPKGIFNGNKPPVTENINVLTCSINNNQFVSTPLVATFARTSFKAGKRFVSELSKHKTERRPYWGYTYYLFTNKVTTEKYNYFVFGIAKGRDIVEAVPDFETVHNICTASAQQLSDNNPSDVAGKTKGRLWQEIMINSAVLDYEDESEVSGEQDGNSDATFDPSTFDAPSSSNKTEDNDDPGF